MGHQKAFIAAQKGLSFADGPTTEKGLRCINGPHMMEERHLHLQAFVRVTKQQ